MKYIDQTSSINVRFSDSDAMGVVWHGNYLKYFEDSREKLGDEFGMSYMDIYNAGFFVPITQVEIKYKAPIVYGQKVSVKCVLIKTQAAKIVYEYEVINAQTMEVICKGKTEQVFIDRETKELELVYPDFYKEWLDSLPWQTK